MPRYIDEDRLSEYFEKRHKNLCSICGETDHYCQGYKDAMLVVKKAPTEDVVPRSKVENLHATCTELAQKAHDVVIKVIDEFQKMLKCETHYETSITGHRYPVVDIDEIDFIAEELKKKYIGE